MKGSVETIKNRIYELSLRIDRETYNPTGSKSEIKKLNKQVQNWAYKNKLVFVEYSYWDYTNDYSKEAVGVYSINDMGKISQIRMYS